MTDEFDAYDIECSYCGKTIYADAARCPKCGNYTDGLGPRSGHPSRNGRRLPLIFVIAGWLVVIVLLGPLLLHVIGWLSK